MPVLTKTLRRLPFSKWTLTATIGLLLWLSWMLSPLMLPSASAAGIMHVKVGETAQIAPSTTGGTEQYSWTLQKDGEVVPQVVFDESGQQQGTPATTSNQRTFRHTFSAEGEYELQVIRTSSNGLTQNSTVKVLVSLDNPTFANKQAVLNTLPSAATDGKVYVSGDEAEVIFFSADSSGNPTEFRIDADISNDSDGDGVADNDIDNANHPSFFTGQSWSYRYSSERSSYIAQLTAVYDTGAEEMVTKEIIFGSDNDEKRNKPLKAILETIPAASDEGIIYLDGTSGKVTFFAGNSEGTIVQYRIDKNINFDTDEDGNPANDIDNEGTPSLNTGSPWETNFEKAWGEVIVELLVVSADQKGSKIQRKVVFGQAPGGSSGSPTDPTDFQKLIISNTEIFPGDAVEFSALGFPEGTRFSWDFEGDGVEDHRGIGNRVKYQYQTAGEFPVTVIATRNDAELARFEKTITVANPQSGEVLTSPPTASFTFSASDNSFSFQNASAADERLLNTNLVHSWDFGDGGTSDQGNPQHVYGETGTYTVVLTVTDAAGRSSTTAQNIEVENIAPGSVPDTTPPEEPDTEPEIPDDNETPDQDDETPETPDETDEEPESEEEGGGGWLWTIVLILFTPILLVLGYLVVRKIQLPDLSFEEIIAEDLEKIRQLRSPKPMEPAVTPAAENSEPLQAEVVSETSEPATQEAPTEQSNEAATAASAEESDEQAEEDTEPAPLAGSDAEAPDWLKQAGDGSDDAPDTTPTALENTAAPVEATPEQPIMDDDTPDWLKTDLDETVSPDTPDATNQDTPSAAAVESDDVPEWLKGDDTDSDEDTASNESDTSDDEDNNADWMDDDNDDAEENEENEDDDDNSVPEWLQEQKQEVPAPEPNNQDSSQGSNTTDDSGNNNQGTQAPDDEADAIPEWLRDTN